jgi:cell fate (sporulation/competence/biofilm development) regulator YlbF (YheA/YmcA/DUF963 family)
MSRIAPAGLSNTAGPLDAKSKQNMLDAIIEELRRLSSTKISKSRLPALRTAYAKADELYERLESQTDDKEEIAEFDEAESRLGDALAELESGCDELEDAEGSEEREMAIEQIDSGLEALISELEEIAPLAKIGRELSALDRECRAKAKQWLSLPAEQLGDALDEWVECGADIGAKRERLEAAKRALHFLRK